MNALRCSPRLLDLLSAQASIPSADSHIALAFPISFAAAAAFRIAPAFAQVDVDVSELIVDERARRQLDVIRNWRKSHELRAGPAGFKGNQVGNALGKGIAPKTDLHTR